ncbi:MAG: hypothetical protein GC180_08295 [Bacteroidetes bacterium]|nr:hypothetical protein [Bacteroidota bacterium]
MNILKFFRKSWFARVLSVMTLLALMEQLLYPMQAYGLTSGPSQPEVQSFEPISTTQMVDPFTGDFSYNIPLFDVGGYPINLSYHSGINMEEEASCVGLGWNINPGAINRNLQGVPDDFNGDKIKYEENFKPMVGVSTNFEFTAVDTTEKEYLGHTPAPFGIKLDEDVFKDLSRNFPSPVAAEYLDVDADKIGMSFRFGLQYHNYRGVGYDVGFGGNKSLGEGKLLEHMGISYDVSFSSFSGLDATAGLSYQNAAMKQNKEGNESKGVIGGASLGIGLNSRTGLKDVSLNRFTQRTSSKIGDPKLTRSPEKTEMGYKAGEVNVARKDAIERSGFQGGMSLLSSAPSYSPTSSSYTKSASYAFSYKTGMELFGIYGYGKLSASVDWYGLDGKSLERKAFGTLYLKNVEENSDKDQFALDYNQVGVKNLNKFTLNMHQMNQTADIYSVTGQGTSGSFKAYLGSMGTFYQPKTISRSLPSGNADLEVGIGNYAKMGLNLKYIHRRGYSGKWREEYGNLSSNMYNFTIGNGQADWESVYMKNVGERIATDIDFYNELGGETPTSIQIQNDKCTNCPKPRTNIAVRTYITDKLSHNNTVSTGNISRTKRAERNQFWSHLTAGETRDFGLTKYVSSSAEDHHVGEITITGEDGRRYVYGQALYNTSQKEVTFNLANDAGNQICAPSTFTYNTSTGGSSTADNTVDNKEGKDHVFRSTETPPYAHAYYLTAVLSADYVDVDNNGPSVNDLGDYVLFNYESAMLDYKWRTPYSENYNTANGYAALLSNDNDDKASYVYGTKEVWYLTSIQSKTQVANFTYDQSGRKDGFEAEGENGGRGSRTLWKLDKIEIYVNHDNQIYDATYHPAPGVSGDLLLKTVHFAYSYDLCPSVPNNAGTNTGIDHPLNPGTDQNVNKGKLTLNKIWFTYRNSNLGEESPYIFQYSSTNPSYDPSSVDRWGNYKPNDCNGKYNSAFPYSLQDESLVHQYASAWNLSQIELPSGGKINVNYESDDYQYVQDRKAMQMVEILGFGKSAADYKTGQTLSSDLYNEWSISNSKQRRVNNFVFVSLPEAVGSNEEFVEKYLKDQTEIYFKVKVNLQKAALTSNEKYEYIEGFATIEKQNGTLNAGVTSDPNVGWISLKIVGLKEKHIYEVNPITKTAWQFIRLNMPYLAFPTSDFVSDPDNIIINKHFLGSMISKVPSMFNLIRGFNGKMLAGQFAKETDPTKSVVRLFNASGKKYGGGSRVSTISFSDEWDQFDANNLNATYTTQYEYTLDDNSSSGVASYEPIIGGEENPFKVPVFYDEKTNPLALANHLYDLEPYCEFLYPAAVVGYSQVKISSVLPQNTQENSGYTITRHGNGYTINKFYTAKDFPTQSSRTAIQKKFKGSSNHDGTLTLAVNKLATFFGITTTGMTASQGFQIILNDMHGKLRSTETFNSLTNKSVIKTEYIYKSNSDNWNMQGKSPGVGVRGELDNNVVVLNPDGTYETKMIGVDVEAFADVNESREITHVPGLDINWDFVDAASLPLLFMLPLPKYKRIENYTLTSTMTKVITKSGILVRTVVTENGYTVASENLAFDGKTGSVLLTKTTNEFSDSTFSLTYPAHWAYEGMGQGYQNIGLEFDFTVSDGFGYASEDQGQYLRKGDEILLPGVNKRYWIFRIEKIDDNGTPKYKFGLLDAAGRIKYDDNYRGKVIRSGHRNMQGIPVGQVVNRTNPLVNGSFGTQTSFSDVLAATAVEYDENWQTFMGFYDLGLDCSTTSDCSQGLSFRTNHYSLRNQAVSQLCLGTTAPPYGNPASICNHGDCPKMTFQRKAHNPANKKIPSKKDPAFDKSKTHPSGMGALMSYNNAPGGYYDGEYRWGSAGSIKPQFAQGILTASVDNSFVRINSFPSCDALIEKMGYTSDTTSTPPYGLFKYYLAGGVVYCAELFSFQYEDDVDILLDEFQVANMSLNFESVETVSGVDYNYYTVIFPMYPDLECYLWTTCPDCNPNSSTNTGGTGTSGEGSSGSDAGPTPIYTTPEITPPGNNQGTLPGGVNPYILGIYGNWRPKRSYIYYETQNSLNQRTQSEDVSGDFNSTNIRKDGTYQNFQIFWNPPATGEISWSISSTIGNNSNPWKWTSESDQYHPFGHEVQTHDVLGIFNSAYMSPINFQPYFVANNSDLKNAIGENFEDYWKFYFNADCDQNESVVSIDYFGIDEDLLDNVKRTSYQWNLWTAFSPYAFISENEAHTGSKSLFISNTLDPGGLTFNLDNIVAGQAKIEVKLPHTLTRIEDNIFEPGNSDLIDRFNPDQTEYVVSFWMKPGYDGSSVNFDVANASVTQILPLMAQPIEGWYKKSYKVSFSSSPGGEAIMVFNTNGDVYIDDFRMHPVHAQMKTFTYDKNLLRLTSTLDENNFATFYEYDLEGNLVRVKRETERGVFTISENRKNLRKRP